MNLAAGRAAIPLYLLLTWTFSSLFYFLIIKSTGTTAAGGAYISALMWCPAIGALLTCRYLHIHVASLGWRWGRTRYQALSYLIPLGYHGHLLGRLAEWNRDDKPAAERRGLYTLLRSRSIVQSFRHRTPSALHRNDRRNRKLRHYPG